MKRKVPFFLLIIPLVLLACTNKTEQLKRKEKEVMDLHDHAMAKMDAIYNEIAHLRELEKTVAEDSSRQAKDTKATILSGIAQLTQADNAMMDWMAAYQPPDQESDFQTTMEYLHQEEAKIKAVDQAIDASLANGKKIRQATQAQLRAPHHE